MLGTDNLASKLRIALGPFFTRLLRKEDDVFRVFVSVDVNMKSNVLTHLTKTVFVFFM